MNNLLVYQNVSFSYTDQKILKNINLTVLKGRFLAIVGESGSGKSTLLKLTMGLTEKNTGHFSGKILFGNWDLLSLDKKIWQQIRGRQIGMIFQNAVHYFDDLQTIGTQYQRMLVKHGIVSANQAKAHMCEALRKAALSDPEELLRKYPFELSGGMAQRTAIAMALDLQPALLLADEPTSALDVTSQKQVLDELLALKETTDLTMIMVTHHMAAALYLADDIAVMKDGMIVETGTRNEILHHPENEYTQALLRAAEKWGMMRYV